MAIHAGAMSNSYSPPRRRPGFFGKLVLLIAFILGIAGILVLLDYYQTNIPSFLMTTFALLGIGLAAGAGSRTLFYKWSGLVRFMMMLIGLLFGLSLLGLFTNWRVGIGPLEPWIWGVIDWKQLVHLGCSLLVSIIALEAWWKPSPRFDNTPVSEPSRTPRSREYAPVMPSPQPSASHQAYPQPQERQSFLPNRSPRLKLAGRSKTRGRTVPRSDKLVLTHSAQKPRSKSRRLHKRKPNLQISMYEEHRCPFCFDVVKHNDPRGVKKCEVCNTLHHADCWEVTGFCQVPHLNT